MTQIICRASICLFWEQGVCSAEEIEYEPDVGCLTFQDMGDIEMEEEEDEELAWERSGDEPYDDDDDDWAEDKDWEEDDDDDDL